MVSVQGKKSSTNTSIKKVINLESAGRMKDALLQMGIKTHRKRTNIYYFIFSFFPLFQWPDCNSDFSELTN